MLEFPSDINKSDDIFLMYSVPFTVTPKQRGVNTLSTIDYTSAIALPTPSEGLSLNESGNWDEMVGYQSLEGFATSAIGKALTDSLGPAGKTTIGKGKFVNDYASLSFSGSNFRAYTFTWDLIPTSEKEAITIAEIIKKIRTNALPSYYGEDSIGRLNYPNMWKVYPCMSTGIDLQLKDCVITNFTVNYTPDGVLRRYHSGHPLSVNMQIEFKELYRAQREDVGA